MFAAWFKFFSLLLLIAFFGTRITESADIIAEKKRWGRAFMGVIFISMITSFPELFTGLSAATIVNSPDISVGEIVGSCIFNIFIIGLAAVFFWKKSVFSNGKTSERIPVFANLPLLLILASVLYFGKDIRILSFGLSTMMIFILYLGIIYYIFRNRREGSKTEEKYGNRSLKKETILFILYSIVIISVGIYLPVAGRELAVVMGWKDSFVGAVFLAFVTSFPELVVSISSARMGAFDMLLGNITGSNLFNLAIIFVVDIFYLNGSLPGNVKDFKIFYLVFIAILMSLILLLISGKKKLLSGKTSFPYYGVILIALYIFSLIIIYN